MRRISPFAKGLLQIYTKCHPAEGGDLYFFFHEKLVNGFLFTSSFEIYNLYSCLVTVLPLLNFNPRFRLNLEKIIWIFFFFHSDRRKTRFCLLLLVIYDETIFYRKLVNVMIIFFFFQFHHRFLIFPH